MKQEILEELQELKPVLDEKFGIEKFAVFGSVAREEETQESDLDVAIISMREKNYFIMIEAMQFLKQKLHREVDMGFFDAMRPFIKKQIAKDMIYV